MAFTLPDNDEAFSANPQSLWMQTDINALAAGIGSDGVISGCAVTAQGTPDMTVAVASGSVKVGTTIASVTSGNVTITAADATNPRIDLVVVNNSGTKSVTAGTAAANPKAPDIPASSVILAMVYVPANDTTIATNQITDKRCILPGLDASQVVSGTLSSSRGGTGVSNAGTLTNASNTSITGGGTLALGGFTLTVPATGTAALGTGASAQVGFWSDANTLAGNAGLTWTDASKILTITNSSATAELRIDGVAGSQSLISLYAAGSLKWQFFRQATSHAFGIYDNTNSSVSFQLDPSTKSLDIHSISGIGYTLQIDSVGTSTRRVARSNTISAGQFDIESMSSTGTPDDGFGGIWTYKLQSSTTVGREALELFVTWATAADASRKARATYYIYDTTNREAMRMEASGSAPLLGFLGATAVAQQAIGAAATDAASTQTLANNIRTALINFGLCKT